MMAKKFFLAMLMALLVTSSWAEEDDDDEVGPELTEEQVQEIIDTQLQAEKAHMLKELELLDFLSNNDDDSELASDDEDDDAGRSGVKDKIKNTGKNVIKAVKKKCDCKSHKVCGCCIKKSIKIPKTEIVFKPKFCGNVTIFPEEKMVGFNLLLGKISLFKKKVSLKDVKGKQCIKLPNMENIELCFKLKVTETEEKGLTSCIKGEANLMLFVQKFRFPCFSFKNGKITADETGTEEDEEEGVSLNIKGAYKGFKKLFGIGSKKTTPAPNTDDF